MECQYCLNVKLEPGKLRCPKCKRWNVAVARGTTLGDGTALLSDSEIQNVERIQTGLIDALFGPPGEPGLARTSVTLLAGEPGAGKTTLCLQLADAISGSSGRETLFIANEQGIDELKATAVRLNVVNLNLIRIVKAMGGLETDLAELCNRYKPCFIILDSVTNWAGEDLAAAVVICKRLKQFTIELNCPSLLVNQVTKGGDHAGLNQLQHGVDTTALFTLMLEEGEEATPTTPRRLLLRKNRFGPAPAEQFFIMTEHGLVDTNPFDDETDADE